MAHKIISNSLFWAKHLSLALVLIIVAVVLIRTQDKAEDASLAEGAKSKSIAGSMSNFYSDYRKSQTEPVKEKFGNFVMQLTNMDDRSLDDRLRDMESKQPVSRRWVGEYKHRTFEAGTTLREAITDYARKEGMGVIWELDQDFIVKDNFQLDDTVAGSLSKIASTVDYNFTNKVNAYVCPKNRSLVITDASSDYLDDHCFLVRS